MYCRVNIRFPMLLLFIFILNGYATDFWLRVPSPTTKFLYKCTFPDSLNGWAAGDSGVIIRTTNGSQSWQLQNSNINYFIEDIFFLNYRLGWAVANKFVNEGALVLSTTNGGLTWMRRDINDTSLVLHCILFLDSLTGWVAGYGGTFLKTSNGGQNWVQKPVDSAFYSHLDVYKTYFKNSQTAYACGGSRDLYGVIWRTVNGGEFWEGKAVGGEPLYDIFFFDSLNGIASGGDLDFGSSNVTTKDGGASWTFNLLEHFGTGFAVANRTRGELWMTLVFLRSLFLVWIQEEHGLKHKSSTVPLFMM